MTKAASPPKKKPEIDMAMTVNNDLQHSTPGPANILTGDTFVSVFHAAQNGNLPVIEEGKGEELDIYGDLLEVQNTIATGIPPSILKNNTNTCQ